MKEHGLSAYKPFDNDEDYSSFQKWDVFILGIPFRKMSRLDLLFSFEGKNNLLSEASAFNVYFLSLCI